MRHGSLFSGIGGFDLAAQWMGWENVFHCEWNEFGQKVLKYHFPQSESFSDITKTDFTKYEGTIDIISGGFPCQPFSTAGKRKGTEDERYLWGEMLRAIQEIKPQFVVAENVFGITSIDGGLVFQQVCLDLETEGYEVQPFIIPSCAKNAPHRRDRVWFIAYAKNGRCGRRLCERCANGEWELLQNEQRGNQVGCEIEGCCGIWDVTNTNNNGCYEQWRYDSRRKINARCNAPFKWSANSKDIDNANSSRNFSGKSRIDGGISEQANVKKDKFADTTRVCTMDKKCDECQRTIATNQCEIVNCGTLVQEGHKGFQSSKRGGMGENCQDISSQRTNEQSNAGTIINRMEGNATNTNSVMPKHKLENGEMEGRRFEFGNKPPTWDTFPSQPPICSGDDGFSNELDGITFSNWRKESVKAYGNAIVPQVAFEIFSAIEKSLYL